MPPGAAGETLEEALGAAYNNNPTLHSQRAALRATDEQVPQALSGWRPTVTVTGELGTAGVETETAFFSRNENRQPKSIEGALTQPLFRGGRTVAETRRAENLVFADRERLAEIEQDVLLRTATAYLDVLREQTVLNLAISNEQRLRHRLEAVQNLFNVGEVTRTDVAQAEARLSNAIAERVQAKGALITARAVYLNVVGRLPELLSWPVPLTGFPQSDGELRQIAVEENPTLLRAVHAERAARNDIALVFGELLPTLDLESEVSRVDGADSRNSVRTRTSISVRLTAPVYQSGSVSARLRSARQIADQRSQEIEERRRTVLENVTLAWLDLVTARAQIGAFRDVVRAAELALEGVGREAAVGLRTTLDILDAEQELFDARVELVRAQGDEVVSSYGLAAAIGRLTAQAINLPVEVYDERRHYEAVRNKLWGLGIDDDD